MPQINEISWFNMLIKMLILIFLINVICSFNQTWSKNILPMMKNKSYELMI